MLYIAHLVLGLASISTALQLPSLQPFLDALPDSLLDYLPSSIDNATEHDLLKRQNSASCPSNWNNCANMGAATLCCNPSAVCSADFAGHVACCPSGVACTGTIGAVITAGTVDQSGNLVGATAAATAATTTAPFQAASTTTTSDSGSVIATSTGGNGFILQGSSTVATPALAVRGAQIVRPSRSDAGDRGVC